ncbi:MAG: hypothetical protein WAT41_12395 [Flavobacteriales bacterium]
MELIKSVKGLLQLAFHIAVQVPQLLFVLHPVTYQLVTPCDQLAKRIMLAPVGGEEPVLVLVGFLLQLVAGFIR